MTIFLDSTLTIELIETGSTNVVNYQDDTEYCETIYFSDIYLDNDKPACSYFLTTSLGFSYALQIPEKYLEKLNTVIESQSADWPVGKTISRLNY